MFRSPAQVIDGWGESPHPDAYDAISRADTPCMDALRQGSRTGRWRLVKAHGLAVGLPSDKDMGNSEVGHNALGAGQVVDQGATCVDNSLRTGELFDLDGWKYVQDAARKHTLHLIGLLSDGGVHSRYDQLCLLIEGALERGVRRVRVHALSDGRDVKDRTARLWVERLQADCAEWSRSGKADVRIASGGGRMCVSMDRYESDWDIVKRGYDAHVLGRAPNRGPSAPEMVGKLQEGDVSDQWIQPWVVVDPDTDQAVGTIQDGDAVVTFNFRADRMVELAMALEYEEFEGFERERWPKIKYAGMMQYDGELKLPLHFLVPPPLIERASEQYLLSSDVSIFACSESQKIGHVTFFWNGNRSGYLDKELETFLEIPSDRGISFDKRPEMKAEEIADAVVKAIRCGKYDLVRCNFPNPDMVGHTGNLEATIEACTAVDKCIKKLLDAIDEVKGTYLITADHGNAEDMVQRKKDGTPVMDKEGKPVPLTSHTLNPVPVIIGGPQLPDNVRFRTDLADAGLSNVTATYINLMGLEAPDFYSPSLLKAD
ncbi:metalloenzyme superfamily protein [Helicosporidium sp. ATCC 50920]|nr:metalloenzyme superfamily protein [Helicosporidium sp. ATCC 50920]|eukprot:KDD76196.1 metalloenzyme superfamily protein [Helicosporidium sp. ATCC 50920]